MSSNIWTQCAGDSRKRALRLEPWRVVESQHQISTRKLVDSDAEQQLLEQMIDGAKPPQRATATLHYLIFTPFRYPPLRHGSRFGTRTEPGIWYGSETLPTAFAEVAYYRLLFLEGSTADLGLIETELSAFRASVRTNGGIDLTRAPFNQYESILASPSGYGETQALGMAMRASNVDAFRYRSARDVEGGINIGVINVSAFGRRAPKSFETWHCAAARSSGVEMVRRDFFERAAQLFPREDFLVDGVLPAPAL
ncbi:MAG: RES family NAD+ phosphorylase [Gemmatimonadota bacterium]